MSLAHETGTVASRDGTPLWYERWQPAASSPWSTLVIVPGRGEHTQRYRETAEAFAGDGLDMWVLDLRGQGHSGGRRGHVNTWREFVQDAQALVDRARQHTADGRVALLGHSMGGLVALHYAVEQPSTLRGLILTSPLCGLVVPVPPWEDWVAVRVFHRWWPTFPFQRSHDDAAWLSHDPQVQTRFLNDPLVHFRVTARLYHELKHAMGRLPDFARGLSVPTLVLQAGDDHIVSADATRRMVEAVGTAEQRYIEYPGLYHELLNEREAPRIRAEIVAWLRQRSATPR